MSIHSAPPFSPRGFTLLELAVVFAFLGLTVAGLLGAARGQLDRVAVLGAREEVVGILHRARQAAIGLGGAEVVLNSRSSSVYLRSSADTLARCHLLTRYAVRMHLSRGLPQAHLTFGPLGLGWVASQTLRFRRGKEETSLVVSSFGRVVRR